MLQLSFPTFLLRRFPDPKQKSEGGRERHMYRITSCESSPETTFPPASRLCCRQASRLSFSTDFSIPSRHVPSHPQIVHCRRIPSTKNGFPPSRSIPTKRHANGNLLSYRPPGRPKQHCIQCSACGGRDGPTPQRAAPSISQSILAYCIRQSFIQDICDSMSEGFAWSSYLPRGISRGTL